MRAVRENGMWRVTVGARVSWFATLAEVVEFMATEMIALIDNREKQV